MPDPKKKVSACSWLKTLDRQNHFNVSRSKLFAYKKQLHYNPHRMLFKDRSIPCGVPSILQMSGKSALLSTQSLVLPFSVTA
jgi:hypothetical protein